MILWSSLLKIILLKAKNKCWRLVQGDTYSGFIDRLAKEESSEFSYYFEAVSTSDDSRQLEKRACMKSVQGMSVRQVMEMISNAENAQMNRILVIEGTTFKQLIDALKKDPSWSRKKYQHLPYDQMLKALDIPYYTSRRFICTEYLFLCQR